LHFLRSDNAAAGGCRGEATLPGDEEKFAEREQTAGEGEGVLQEAGARLTQEAGSKVATPRGKVADLAH
jgi:hypothetical protein